MHSVGILKRQPARACAENIGWSEQRQSRNAPHQITEGLNTTIIARA
jgi:hypothetical protein